MREKLYFSYIRVSTVRQGQTGTSLNEQSEAIERYAERWSLKISRRFEEKETAAKLGRPVFNEMLKALKQGKADGVIIHKIDRSARNLKDWANLGELLDGGIEVHFANESLDLNSRGGRLSADIQAVVAADFIRNLREETKKGFYGRLKQGLYPRPAPIGYLDKGKGKAKEPDPVQAPLVRKAFELYATGRFGLNALIEKMGEFGLRSKKGEKVSLNGLASMLHNTFYIGLINFKVRGELFRGAHQPIVPQSLFNEVQQVLSGKRVEKKQRNFFIFRKLLSCADCQATLIGEIHKSYTYYRCQSKSCVQKTIRQEVVESAFVDVLNELKFNEVENAYFRKEIKKLYDTTKTFREVQTKALTLQLEQIRNRVSKLADAYIEGVLDKEIYLEKKNQLLIDEQMVKENLNQMDEREYRALRRVEHFLELANQAQISYKTAKEPERREFAKLVTSNIWVKDKKVSIKLEYPFAIVAEREGFTAGSPQRGVPRTLSAILSQLCCYFRKNELFLEGDDENVKSKFPLDQQIIISARKITSQRFAFGRHDSGFSIQQL